MIDALRQSTVLTVLAKLLAATGVYALVSYVVSGRVWEMGIRVALGTNKREVVILALRRPVRPAAIGALVGLVSCVAFAVILCVNLSAAISVRLLCGIGLGDPVSFLLVPGFLLSVALLVSYVAARRVRHVDPMVALRPEWVY